MNIISPINQLGYGIAGLNIVKSMAIKRKTSLFVIGNPEVTNREDADIVNSCLQNAQTPDFNSPCLRIWHQNDMSQFVGKSDHIGFPFFELDTFQDVEKHHLNSLDKLFVTSSWAKDIVLANLSIPSDKVFVVPLGVDSSIFKPSNNNQSSKTVFFNCGKWEVRKGHDVLVDMFNKAFSEEDDVELWMMCQNPFLSKEESQAWKDRYKQSKLGSKIKIIPRLKSQEEVYNIMETVDCGIFPSRAEGWNLELLELLSCGKMAIASNVSAHTEFCNTEAVTLIDMPEKELAYDNKWFFNQGSWAKITDKEIDNFAQAMRDTYNKNQKDKSFINKAGIEIAKKFSWENTTQRIQQYA